MSDSGFFNDFDVADIFKWFGCMKRLPARNISKKQACNSRVGVIVVDECMAGRNGIEEVILEINPKPFVNAVVGKTTDFWRLNYFLLQQTDFVLIHVGSHSQVQSLIYQINLITPHINIIVLLENGFYKVRFIEEIKADHFKLDYGASLVDLKNEIDMIFKNKSQRTRNEILEVISPREWLVLAGALSGKTVTYQAVELGVSTKTLYSQRSSAILKLGLSSVRDFFKLLYCYK